MELENKYVLKSPGLIYLLMFTDKDVRTSRIILLNGTMISEWWIRKDVEVREHDLIWDIIMEFAWRSWERPHKSCEESQHPSHDSNWTPLEYMSEALLLELTYSVFSGFMVVCNYSCSHFGLRVFTVSFINLTASLEKKIEKTNPECGSTWSTSLLASHPPIKVQNCSFQEL